MGIYFLVRKINVFNVNNTKKLENNKNKVEFHFPAMTTVKIC